MGERRLAYNRSNRVRQSIERELLARARAARLAEPLGEVAVGEHAGERVGEGELVAGRHAQARGLVGTLSARPPMSLATTAVPRIIASVAVRPNGSGQREGTACTQPRSSVRSSASPPSWPCSSTESAMPSSCDERAQRRLGGPGTGDREPRIRHALACEREGAHEDVGSLLRGEAAGEGDRGRSVERRPPRPVAHAGPDHVVRLDPVGLELATHVVRAAHDRAERAAPAAPERALEHQRSEAGEP